MNRLNFSKVTKTKNQFFKHIKNIFFLIQHTWSESQGYVDVLMSQFSNNQARKMFQWALQIHSRRLVEKRNFEIFLTKNKIEKVGIVKISFFLLNIFNG